MTISTTESEISYATDGSTRSFPIPFVFDSADDLKVVLTDEDGNVTEVTSGFSTTGGNGSTGTLVFSSAPADNQTLTIIDDPALEQTIDYVSNDAFPAETNERGLDYLTRLVKRLTRQNRRTLRTRDGDPLSGDDLILPSVQNRAERYLFFNEDGDLEPAAAIALTTLSQSIIGALLFSQTSEEQGATITPADRRRPGGNEHGVRWAYSSRYTLNADGATDDSSNLNALVYDGMNMLMSPDTYFVDANPGTEERGWVVHGDNMRIEGYNWSTTLKNNTANQSVINMGDAAANERKSGNAVGWITFQDVPGTGSGGSDNNEHPLHFIAQNHPLAYFNRFIDCGLGLRFGRARTAKGGDGVSTPTGGDGTRFGLALGNYFEGMEGMSLEIMDDGSYGNQLIGNRIASPGTDGNHTVRINGNYNLVSALTSLDGMSTLVSAQGGVGHVATGLVGTGQAQAIQSFKTAPDGTPAPKYSVVSSFAVGNTRDGSTSYGARLSELSDFVLGPGVIYHDSPNSSAAAGVYVLNNVGGSSSNADPRYCVIGPVITANTKGTTSFPHNFVQGYYHHINLIAHGADGGNASVFEIDDASGQCTLDVSVERAASNPSDTDVRIEGAGHIGRIHGEKIIVSGSNHILDIVQPAGTVQAITINASDCIFRIRATGAVVVNGARNVITLMSSLASGTAITFNPGADNNLLMGLKDINMTDNGTGNTTTGMVTY